MSLDTDPDAGDLADLYKKMLADEAEEQTRDWTKWHLEHPYIHHPRQKHPKPSAHRPRVEMSQTEVRPRTEPIPVPSEVQLKSPEVERFRKEAQEISQSRYGVGSDRGKGFEAGYIAARLHAFGMRKPEATLLGERQLGVVRTLSEGVERATHEGAAAGYRMHGLGPDRVNVEPSVSRVAEKPYDDEDKRTVGITTPDKFAVGDRVLPYYPNHAGGTIAKVSGTHRVTVTYEDGHKETFSRKSYGHASYNVVAPGHDTPADRAGLTSVADWRAFNTYYRQEARKISSEAPTSDEAKGEREAARNAMNSMGANVRAVAEKAKAAAYDDALAGRNGLHTEDRTAGELQKGDVLGHVNGGPVRVVSVAHPTPGRVVLTLTHPEGTGTMGETTGDYAGVSTDLVVGSLAKAHVSNMRHEAAKVERKKMDEEKAQQKAALASGSPKVPYTEAHFREAKRQVAELLLRQELTKQTTLADRARAERIEYHYGEHASPGDFVLDTLRQKGAIGSGSDGWRLGTDWTADFVRAVHEAKTAAQFDAFRLQRPTPSPEDTSTRLKARNGLMLAARSLFKDAEAAEADWESRDAVAAAHEMAKEIADDAPTHLNEDLPQGKWTYDALRQHVEAQMGIRPFGSSKNWRPGTSSMSNLNGLSVEDFARHAAVMEKGREIAARIDAHPELAQRRQELAQAEQAYKDTPRPMHPMTKGDLSEEEYDKEEEAWRDSVTRREVLASQERAARERLSAAYRSAAIEEMGKEREMGGGVAEHPVIGTNKKIETAFREALARYPTQWIANSALGRLLTVRQAKTRGHYADITQPNQTLKRKGASGIVSQIKMDSADDRGMVHEIGHRMEYTNDGLMRLEATHLETRAPGERASRMEGYSASEVARADKFVTPYMGKVYLERHGPDKAHELFTVGMESLFGSGAGNTQGRLVGLDGKPPDPDSRAFILGALALHANPALAQ